MKMLQIYLSFYLSLKAIISWKCKCMILIN